MSNGASIIANITSNITNTYSYLSALNPKGVTYDSITQARNDQTNYLTLNQPFATYLQNNFNNFDKDGDGIISAKEMSQAMSNLSKAGISKAELSQLAASGACSAESLSKIMDNFDEIDSNNDGKITNEEISAYSFSCNRQAKIDEENYKKATGTSVFYGEESSSELDSYSILSYRYKNFNS